jgi:hypothetical protein
VAVLEAAAVLTERWQQLRAELDDTGRRLLDTLVEQFELATTEKELDRTWRSAIDLATDRLAGTSSVRVALDRVLDDTRSPADKVRGSLPRPPGVTPIGKPSVHTWVHEAPAWSASRLRRMGVDPERAGLIRFRKPDGPLSLPLFQFTRAGDPKPLVLRINEVLGADADPLGAADWWLCPNVWLDGTPAELLGVADDHVLLAAAVAAVEG